MKWKLFGNGILKRNIYYYFFMILITISSIWNIDKAIMPYCVSDEIGYWTAAAWINNFDWSPVMSHSQYYGWGYGILLSFIFKIPNPILRFRMAIVINAILLNLLFIFLVKICDLLFDNNDKKLNVIMAGMATCYSYNIIFAHTSMCEVFLTFLYVLSIYIFMKFVENPNRIHFFAFGILLILQLATHLRMLVCIIALIITITGMCCVQKIDIKRYLAFILLCSLVIIVVYFVKDLLVQSEYTSVYVSERLTGNEGVANHLSVFRSALDLEFWYELIYSLEGKIYYLLCSTLFMMPCALIYVADDIKQYFVSKYSENRTKKNVYLLIKIYICLCFLGALAVDTIYAMKPNRIDSLLYGRYVENMLPVIICMGCYWFIKRCDHKKFFLIVLILLPFMGKKTLLYLDNLKVSTSIPLNIGWFSGWITQDRMNDYFYYTLYPLFISLCMIVIFILLSSVNVKSACVWITICWIISAENGWLNVVTPQLDRMNEVIEASCELKQEGGPFYCVIPESLMTDSEEFVDVNWLQYQIGTDTLYEINIEEFRNSEKDLHIIVNKKNKNYDLYVDNGSIIWSNSRFSIIQHQSR